MDRFTYKSKLYCPPLQIFFISFLVQFLALLFLFFLPYKGGQQSLLLYVNLSITQPPVDRLNSNFACRAQMGSSFLEIIFLC